jgi:benzylsuccinate CoA-transferase BbsF subunit
MSDKGILNNIRILDFSWVLAGPYATRILADFGAEVIKVQPLLSEAQDRYSLGYSNNWNRNKLGISVNMNEFEGREIARKLVKISDVVVENFSPRVMVNWGLDYPELKKIKTDIILLSMSVMGREGDGQYYSGFGPTVQAFSGLSFLTTYADHPPLGVGYSYADHISALYGCLSLLGALEYRHKTGEGQYIDLSQTDATTSLLSDTILNYTQRGITPEAVGNCSNLSVPHGVYRCQGRDKWCAISVSTDSEWEGLKRALGSPSWSNEDRFSSFAQRLINVESLDSLVQGWTQVHSDQEVMESLQKQGVPAGKVQNAGDLICDPQLNARGFFVDLHHPVLGNNITDASPVHLSNNSAVYHRTSPTHGQDNDYVFRELLGFSDDTIKELRQNKTI